MAVWKEGICLDMERLHFFERLERENNYQREYEKLEELCAERHSANNWNGWISINLWIDENFRKWSKRSNYCSYDEVRAQLGLSIEKDYSDSYVPYEGIGLNEYVIYCEMLINIISGIYDNKSYYLKEPISTLFDTIRITVEKAGLEIREQNGDYIIVTKDAMAIEVAETNPAIADIVIEYNQYLLRGNIKRKKELLKAMVDALEPEKSKLSQICARYTKDYFYLANNMDIRHNNCNPNDKANYNEKFANLTDKEKEDWYDLIYSQGLFLFMNLKQQDRNVQIDSFKEESI